jgi:SWI/SNF-related matrix-associated actin-dependent regulator 1 of chromatin subfamily A
MEITYKDGNYLALCTFYEKEIPKGAGFQWSPTQRVWYTTRPEIAARLAPYADSAAKSTLGAIRDNKKIAVDSSRAVDAALNIPAPDGLAYLPFQKAGIAYAIARPATLIADEMGLGKTIQAIGFINAMPDIKRVLIICPASLKINWAREIQKWLTRPMTIGIANSHYPSEADVVIINYDILEKHHARLGASPWDLLITDECHYLKNSKTQRTRAVLGGKEIPAVPGKRKGIPAIQAIPAKRKLFLTGTPIVNRPIELWPLLRAMDPAGLGKSWHSYVVRYCAGFQDRWGWNVSGASNLDELQEHLRSALMVRRLKKDVLTELPPKRRQVIEMAANGAAGAVALENTAWQKHEERLSALRTAAELSKASDSPEDYKRAVEALREGAQIAFTEISLARHQTALAKVPAVVDFLHNALDDADEKIVLFAHHRDVIDAISKEFNDISVKLTGETKQTDRQEAVDRFQKDPKVKLFIGSITAAGLGITLTASAHVIFAELDWVPGNITQAEDRTHRIGQLNSVLVQHLVLDESLDARMAKTLVGKQQVIERALDKETEPAPVLIPTQEQPATSTVSRKKVEEEAIKISPAEVAEIHAMLQSLSAMCDGARALDGVGFNKFDAPIGHSLAKSPRLSPKQAVLGKRIVNKYRRQLGG